MGQHSGHWAFAASLPFAAALMSLFVSIADRSVSAEGRSRPLSLTSLTFHRSIRPPLPDVKGSGADLMELSDPAVIANSSFVLSIPPNALLVVGSLDLSGASHNVVLDSAPFAAANVGPSSVQRSAHCLRLSARDVRAPDVADQEADSPSKPECVFFNSGNPPVASVVTNSAQVGQTVRHFFVPHFEQETTSHGVTEGIRLAQSARVSVFLDQSLCQSDTLQDAGGETPFVRDASELCQRLENGLLDHVTAWIGPITDVDGDERLTLVITDLDRRVSPADPPVLGCVRDRDFLGSHESDLSGDILYLDRRLPTGDSLNALLAHELTHAAIFSLLLQARTGFGTHSTQPLPSWLNESMAHLVESSVAGASTSFSERVRQFHANSAASPIVASETHLPFAARRGGSRAAGTLFLQHLATTPDALRSVIRSREPIERRLESLTRNCFGETFRTWSIRHSQMAERSGCARIRRSLAQGDRVSQRLFGTAFCCFRGNGPVQDLRITSDDKAALQITVIEGAAFGGP